MTEDMDSLAVKSCGHPDHGLHVNTVTLSIM